MTPAKAQPPRERLLPLSYVEFLKPVAVDGFPTMLRRFVKGVSPDPEVTKDCPKLFLDPELQAIVIEDNHFPIHLVVKYKRAKAA